MGGRSKNGGQSGTPTPDADAPTGLSLSGVSDARNRRKHGRWCRVLIHRRGRGASDQSYALTIGKQGATEGWTKLGKVTSVGPREVCFFRCYLWGSSLKDTLIK